jgi:hypothetical protein
LWEEWKAQSAVWPSAGKRGERRRRVREGELVPTLMVSCGRLAASSSELIWRGDTSTVVGMDSAQRIKPRDLVVGGRYLHYNRLFIREIEAIEGHRVHYHDQETSGWSCSDSAFVRACPTVATAEDEARSAQQYRELARLGAGSGAGRG